MHRRRGCPSRTAVAGSEGVPAPAGCRSPHLVCWAALGSISRGGVPSSAGGMVTPPARGAPTPPSRNSVAPSPSLGLVVAPMMEMALVTLSVNLGEFNSVPSAQMMVAHAGIVLVVEHTYLLCT